MATGSPLRTAIGAALYAMLLCAASPAEVVQRPQGNISTPGALAAPDRNAAPASPDLPDERPLWRMLSARDDAALTARIARLRLAYPTWQPPAEMLGLLADRAQEREYAQAKAAHDWAAIRRLAAGTPKLAVCARADDAAVAAASPGAASTLAQVFAACPNDAARIALLEAAANRFGEPAVAPLLDRIDGGALPPDAQARLSALRAGEKFGRLARALADGDPAALALGETLRPMIEARRDGGTAIALGYAAMKAGRPRDAIGWFETGRRLDPNQPVDGLARAYFAAGDTGTAARLLGTEGNAPVLAAQIAQARIAEAYRRGDYPAVVAATGHDSDPPILLGWSLFRLHRLDAAAAAFARRNRAHREPAAAEGLLLSLTEAGRPDAAAAAAAQFGDAVQAALRILPRAAGPDLGYRVALARLRAALDRHDAVTADPLAAALAAPVLARQDDAAAVTLGWSAFAGDRMDAAARWFAMGARDADPALRDDGEYGAALTAYRLGDVHAAEAAAAGHPSTGRWAQLERDAAMLRAQRQIDADPASAEAIATARAVLRADPQRRDAIMLLAWNDVRTGRRQEAAAAFERLYRAQPDAASASGLANATTDFAPVLALAAELGGPLAGAIQDRAGRDAFGRKAFLAADRIDPGLDPALGNLDAPVFSVNGAYRSKSGGAGTSRLQAETSDIAASVVRDLDRFTLRLHLVSLDAGSAPPPPPAHVAGMTTRLPLGVEPVIAWERQSRAGLSLSPSVELGLTPLGGVVGPTVQAQARLGWQGPAGSLTGTLFRQSITESLLSFTGIVDPVTGRHFGRVTESGGRLEAYAPLAPRWGVYGQSSIGLRDGVDVRTNLHLAASATLSYELRLPGFDYATLGPAYQFSHFDHDLSGFTPGQGGYYSPDASHGVGAAWRFLTTESRDFILRGSSFAGWQFAHSDGAADGHGGKAPATRQDGFSAIGQLNPVYRVAPRWFIGGLLRYQVSPQYNDLYAGLSLTYSLGDRAALLSADLPRFDER